MNPTTERPDRELLAKAAAQAGLDPDRVLEQLDRGAFDQALRKLNPHGSEMIAEVLQSPDAMAQLLRQPGPQALLRQLSGGNQQKVVFSRALASGADILLLNHPTRGVDVGAKEEIYALIRDMTDEGKAVIVLGDTTDECIGLCSRLLVMKDGLVTGEFDAPADHKPSQVDVVSLMM